MPNKQQIGKLGQDLAERYLLSQNYQIICRNFYSRYGEIDLVAFYNNQLIFCEVKTRTSDLFGAPEESFTYRKRSRFIKTVFQYLAKSPHCKHWRIDLIAVKLDHNCKFQTINHFQNI